MNKERKPFKETRIGVFLKEKAPAILDKVADILPDNGALGIVKNIIDKDETISHEDKAKAIELLNHELALYEAEIRDRESARLREIEYVKANKKDWMMIGVCSIVCLAFISLELAVLINPEKYNHNTTVAHIIGIIEGAFIGVVMYYFGSSKGSSDKTKMMVKKN